MARLDAAVPPLHAGVSGRAASNGNLRVSRHARILTRLALALLSLLAFALVIANTLIDLYAARELHLGQALEQAEATASLIAERLDNFAGSAAALPKPSNEPIASNEAKLTDAQKLLAAAIPFHSPPSDLLVGVTDRSGHVIASVGFQREIRSIGDLVGREHVAEANRSGAGADGHARRRRCRSSPSAISPSLSASSPSWRRLRARWGCGASMRISSLASPRSQRR